MQSIQLKVNGVEREIQVEPEMPLLWVLRDVLGLTGTKYACGIAKCGACMVHLDGAAVPSCVTPVSAAAGREVTTIEGLSPRGQHPLQRSWIELQVPQCGFCQSGQIMAAAALLQRTSRPSDTEIDQAMSPVLCRCGTYPRVRAAIHHAAAQLEVGSVPVSDRHG